MGVGNEICVGNWLNWVMEEEKRGLGEKKIEREKEDMEMGWMLYR